MLVPNGPAANADALSPALGPFSRAVRDRTEVWEHAIDAVPAGSGAGPSGATDLEPNFKLTLGAAARKEARKGASRRASLAAPPADGVTLAAAIDSACCEWTTLMLETLATATVLARAGGFVTSDIKLAADRVGPAVAATCAVPADEHKLLSLAVSG